MIIIHETPSNRVLKQVQTVIKIEFRKEEVKIGETWRICRCLTTQYIYWKVQIPQQGNRLKPYRGEKKRKENAHKSLYKNTMFHVPNKYLPPIVAMILIPKVFCESFISLTSPG